MNILYYLLITLFFVWRCEADEIVETITPNNVQSNNLNFEGKAINYPSTISIVGRKQKAVVFMKLLVNKNGINESRVVIHDVDTLSSLAMAVDAASNKAFCNENWVKESGEKIKVINLESNKVEKKLDLIEHIGEEMVTSLAFDWIGKNLFVAIDTDPIQNTGRIYVCRVDVPSKCGVVISKGLTNLESIAVDPIDGYLYWINKHGKRIERSFMNGMHHDKHPFQENLEKDNVYRLTSLTLDLVNKKLYYVAINSISSEIFVCDFYQRNSCKPIIANIQTSHIDHYDNKIYWTSTNTNSGSIYYCKKNFCENTSKMIANSSNIEDFALVAVKNQPPRTDPNPCAINNGDCSDICILHPGEPFYSCQCPVGIKLKSNGKTCNPDGIEEVLFIASATNLLYISLDTPELIPRPLHKNDSNTFLKIQDLDYDSRRQWIYWLDGIEYKVMRGKWNDTLIETVHSFDKKEAIEAFKVDYIGQNLIWIDSENGKIEMMSMESKSRKIVYFSKFLKNTNSFAYDIVSGIIMFTEKKHGAFIFKSIKVDGSDETTLLQLPIGSSPMGIEIDSKLNKFYWAESGSNSILSADLQTGTNVEILSSGLRNPFSISKLGERLYFNSINDRTLSYINLQDYDEVGDKTAEEYSNFDNPNVVLISDAVINGNQKGLKVSNVVSKMPTSRFDLCVNKQCTHICTTVNDGIAKCLCKNGQVLSEDGVTCQSINASLIYSRFSIDDDLMRSSVSPQFNLNERMFLGGISDSIQYIYPFRDSLLIAGTGRSPNHFHQQIGYIKKINLTNHQTTTLLISTSSPLIDGISVDDVTGNIFFANRYLKRIEIINEKGSVRRTLLWKNIDPSLVVVEKSQNMLYFVNDSISILRTPIYLNYQHLTTVIKCEDPITSFAIDHHSKLLIYATMNIHDLTKGTIYSTNLDGTNKKQLLSIPKLHALHITPHHLSLLFFNKHNGSVMAFENNELHHHSQIDDLISLTILTTTNAHPSSSLIKAACSAKPSSKAFCNHICLAKNLVESECVCQDHFIYDKEKKICVIKESFVMVSESNKLVRFQIDKVSGGADTLENEPPFYFDLPNIGEINSLSFDPMSVKKYFYWIDSADPSNVVRSSMLPDEPSMTMDEIKEYSKCKSFHYLTIDNSGRQLFVSCSLTLALNMSSIHAFRITAHDDFIYVGVIVSESRYSPRQIEVFNKLNALFFINAISDTSSRIIRCRFDGRDCKALSYTSTDDLSWHSLSLASDTFSQRLLYSSPSSIYSKDVHVDLDLRQRLNLNDILHNSQAFAMSTIAFSHNSLAIAINSRARSGLFLLKYNTSSHANTFNDLVSLAYYGPSRGSNVKILGRVATQELTTSIHSACHQSQCSHLCRSQGDFTRSSSKFQCLCPYNLRQDPQNSFNCMAIVPCKHYQFACDDGLQCISMSKKCDRVIDCLDTSDENSQNCLYNQIPMDSEKMLKSSMGFWPCLSGGKSISKFEICDGKIDCPDDNSDELYCKCEDPQSQFDCEIKTSFDFTFKASTNNAKGYSNFSGCISRKTMLCDGIVHCENGTDEAPHLCSLIEMHSANGVGNNQKEKTFTFAIFAIGIAIFVMLVILLFVNCCKKSNSSKVQSNVNPRETHFLLNQSNQQTHMVEVALKTFNSPIQQENYYVFGSGEGDQSTIPVMIDEPTPTRNQSSILKQHPYSMNSSYATAYDPSSQQHYGRHVQFYAPPPSAASLSTTYGVVKQIPYTLRKANSTSTHSYVSESMPPPPYEYLHRPLPQQEGSSNSSNYYTLRSHTKSGRRPPANSRQGTTAESSDSEESNYL